MRLRQASQTTGGSQFPLTCAKALADVIGVERMMELKSRAADQLIRFISHQLRHPGSENRKAEYRFRFTLKRRTLSVSSAPHRGQGRPTCPRSA